MPDLNWPRYVVQALKGDKWVDVAGPYTKLRAALKEARNQANRFQSLDFRVVLPNGTVVVSEP